jgi:hypothetical protein
MDGRFLTAMPANFLLVPELSKRLQVDFDGLFRVRLHRIVGRFF